MPVRVPLPVGPTGPPLVTWQAAVADACISRLALNLSVGCNDEFAQVPAAVSNPRCAFAAPPLSGSVCCRLLFVLQAVHYAADVVARLPMDSCTTSSSRVPTCTGCTTTPCSRHASKRLKPCSGGAALRARRATEPLSGQLMVPWRNTEAGNAGEPEALPVLTPQGTPPSRPPPSSPSRPSPFLASRWHP